MPSTGSIIRTREFIYFHPPPTLYAARHCACHSCLALAGSNAAAEDQALLARQLCLAFACLLALSRGLSARVKASISLQPSIHPFHPAHPPNPHLAIAFNLPFPINSHPSAIAASLRQHRRLCAPSRAYQSLPNHACRSKGWRCICDHRASTSLLLLSASIRIAPLAISPGSPHHRLTTAITLRDPSIDPQMAP